MIKILFGSLKCLLQFHNLELVIETNPLGRCELLKCKRCGYYEVIAIDDEN